MAQWDKFIEIVRVLEIPYEATNAIQKASYTLSDFFACWLKIDYKLNKLIENGNLVTDLAPLLSKKLAERKKDLFSYPTMLSAIYLDPRVRAELTNNELMLAKFKLEELHSKIQEVKKQSQPNDEAHAELSGIAGINTFEDSFNQYLAKKAADKTNSNQPVSHAPANDENNFFLLLEKFEKSSTFQSTPILEYWESQKEEHPALYELACVINSIPPSQATVERSFSILKFIFTCKRHNLKVKMLEDILMIKLNETMIQSINEQDINDLQN